MDVSETEWASDLSEAELLQLIIPPDDIPDFDLMTGLCVSEFDRIMSVYTELKHINKNDSIDNLGDRLLPPAISNMAGFFDQDYWAQLKYEFALLVCTKEKKYQSLRKKLSSSANKSHATIVSTIAAVIATDFGITAGVLVPFIAMCLIAMLRMSKEAFCATWEWDVPLVPGKTNQKNTPNK